MKPLLALITGENGRGVTNSKIFRYGCSTRSRSTFIAGLSSYWLMLGPAAQIKEGRRRRGAILKALLSPSTYAEYTRTYMQTRQELMHHDTWVTIQF